MKKTLLLLLLAVLPSFAPIQANADGRLGSFIFDDKLREVFLTGNLWMTRQREEVYFDSGARVDTCAEYIEASKTSYVDAWDANNTRHECEYFNCHILAALAESGKPHKGYRPESYAREVFNRLDWRSVLNDGIDFANDKKHTLAQVNDPYVRIKNDHYIELDEEKVWYMGFEVIADADLNNNGKPDWQFTQYVQALGGTMFTCVSGVIWDVEPTGPLKAVMYPLKGTE